MTFNIPPEYLKIIIGLFGSMVMAAFYCIWFAATLRADLTRAMKDIDGVALVAGTTRALARKVDNGNS